MTFEQLGMGVIGGVISGMIAAALGYAKNSKEEDFDDVKLLRTVITGAFVGGFAGYYGMTYDNAMAYLTTSGGILLFEYGLKAIWKRVGDKIKAGLKKIDDWLKS